MKTFLTITIFAVLAMVSFAQADPRSDATFIVEQHMLAKGYDENLTSISQETLANLQPGFERLGAEIINSDLFLNELVGDFHQDFLEEIREESIEAYLEILTPEQLAALAGFYRSGEGQKMLVQSSGPSHFQDFNDFFRTDIGVTILERMPELLERQERPIHDATIRIKQLFTMDHIADIMEMESIVAFEDEDQRHAVLNAMRNAEAPEN